MVVWKTDKLSSLGITQTGSTPKTSIKENFGSAIPFIKPANFYSDGTIDYDKDGLSEIGLACSRLITKNSILMVCIGATIGKVGFTSTNVTANQQINSLTLHDGLYPKYFYYAMLDDNFKHKVIHSSGQATLPIINKTKWSNLKINYPDDIEEQKRIVALLDTVFADLEQTRAKTEQNLKNARELFDSYLQQVFNEKGKGYEQVALSEITESISDGDHSAPPKSAEGIPFITISNINKKTLEIDFSNTFKVPEEYYSALKANRKPKAGDILYTVTGSYGIPVIVTENKDFCFQRHIGLVRPDNGTNSQWLYYLLMSPQVFNQADSGATGTAQKTVSLKLLRGILVPNIPLNIQKEMVEGLDYIYQKSKVLENVYTEKLKSISELKKSILQKAFSGELTASVK
jgi:type I restriction enzyme S subunit